MRYFSAYRIAALIMFVTALANTQSARNALPRSLGHPLL